MSQEKIVDKSNNKTSEHNTENKKINIWSLCKYSSLRYKFIFLNILWIGTRAAFNGVSISSKSLKSNFYVNITALFILESISYFVIDIIIDIKKLGRKGTLLILYSSVIIIFVLLAFLKLNIAGSLALNYIARFICAGIDVIYYTYTTELYPTLIRSLAFGINTGFGNLGSIAAPYLLEFLKKWQCLVLFASMFALNAIIILFFPETVGKPMVESIQELDMGKGTGNKNEDKKSEIGIKILNISDNDSKNFNEKEEKESNINMINYNKDVNEEVVIYKINDKGIN